MKTTLRLLKKGLLKFLKGFLIFIVITAIGATVVVQFSGDSNYKYQAESELVVNDVTGLNPIRVGKVIKPKQTSEIIEAIHRAPGQSQLVVVAIVWGGKPPMKKAFILI